MNDMKHTITHSLAALLLIAGLAGCSEEETLSGTPGDTRTPITITVTDGGYIPDDAARQSTAGSDIRQNADDRPSTRAVDNGYATTFTAGDQIGLYIVKSDGNGTSYAAENICLTLTDMGDGTSAWQAPATITLYYEGAAAKYLAYYPYQQTLPAVSNTPDTPDAPDAPDTPAEPVKPNASATDASGFFAPLISAWTPATDQGTHAAYTASDLMTGSGTASKQSDGTYSLSLTMTHAMALVVIETPMTKYALTDKDGTSLPDYCIPAPDTRFYGFTPYNPSPGTYRYLVKPGQSGVADLMGSYTATLADGSTATKEYAVSPVGITAANYALYKVDGATVTQKTHQLQVGDFYMNDGSLLAGSTATLTAAQKQACIGVVYCVDNSFITNNSTNKSEGGYIHGLVVALKDASTSSNWNNAGNAASNYGNTVAVPSGSSGWYLPNLDELKYICWGNNSSQSTNGKENLNTLFGKLSDSSANVFGNYYYWSSTEDDDGGAYAVYFGSGNAGCYAKNANARVRSSLAF